MTLKKKKSISTIRLAIYCMRHRLLQLLFDASTVMLIKEGQNSIELPLFLTQSYFRKFEIFLTNIF